MGDDRLAPFIGEWDVEATFPDVGPTGMAGRTTFEWALDDRYVLQRASVDHPAAPDLLAVIAPDHDAGGYRQHYFDSRGVVRLYAMTIEDGVWTLLRERADFTPLSFRQRFMGEFSDDGSRIDGRWEKDEDGGGWQLDFELTYVRR